MYSAATARNLTTTPKGTNFGRNFGFVFSLGVSAKLWTVTSCTEICGNAAVSITPNLPTKILSRTARERVAECLGQPHPSTPYWHQSSLLRLIIPTQIRFPNVSRKLCRNENSAPENWEHAWVRPSEVQSLGAEIGRILRAASSRSFYLAHIRVHVHAHVHVYH